MQLSPHAVKNREAWTALSAEYVEPGRRAWAKTEPDWGIFGVPEAEVGALQGLDLSGKDTIELGCGTAYISAWLYRMGARPVGIDITPAQLESARTLQKEFGIEFPLIEGSAEAVPLPDASFDFAVSEYGASIWCDPHLWIAEAARLLRPGGTLVFLRNSTISLCCMPMAGPPSAQLCRSWFELEKTEWPDDGSVEFHLDPGAMIRLLRRHGFEIEDLVYLRPPQGSTTRYEFMTAEWALKWPCEEIWRARLR
jgi:SAM-dependent methyltransferase